MRILPKLIALLGLCCAAASAAAPRPADPLAGIQSRTLPNGLRVLVLPRHTAPVVTTMMWYRVGSRDELPGATGLAHFLEHMLFKGTKKLPKGAVDRITYQNGGSNNAFTFNDFTAYQFNLPKQTWKVALSIEADRMRNTVFDPKEFEAERQVVMEERRISEDDPPQRFSEQLSALAFMAHPYRNPVIGWMADLKRVTRDEVYDFYRRYYVPANATLVVTGDVGPEEAFAAVRAAFAGVPRLPAPKRVYVAEPPQEAERRLRLSLATGVARLGVIFPAVSRKSPDVYALTLLDYALTEGKLSRLYSRLVDREQLAADVDSSLGAYRELGELALYANAREGASLERLEAVLWEELERLAREPLTATELERAKNQFYADWVSELDTANALAAVIGEADALGGLQHLTTFVPRVQTVTAADVQRAAAKYLRRDRANIGHLLPRQDTKTAARPTAARPLVGRSAAARTRTRPTTTSQPHNPATSQPFSTLRPTEKTLPNGLRLVLLEKHDVPTVILSARIRAGSFQETDAQSGLANLTARMLEEGTRSRSHTEISAALEQVGATFSASASRDATDVDLESLSSHTAALLPLYADLLRAPSFPADRLDAERSRLLVELREEEDDASAVARRAFSELVYGSHPAHRPVSGKPDTVRALRTEDLLRYHERHYRPENVTLVAVGDFHTPELLARLTEAFSGWERGAAGTTVMPAPPASPSGVRSRRIPMEKAQVNIVLGHLGVRRASPDYIPLRVLDTILGEGVGGGFTARIPYQLRDVQGLAYGVGSSITGSAGTEPGVFIAALGTEPKKEKTAIAALLAEIRKIRSAPVTEAELREAVNYLASSYVFQFQTNAQLADYLQAVLHYGLGYDYRRQFVGDVRRVTRADVLRVARKHLDPERYTLVVVGPEGKGRAGKDE